LEAPLNLNPMALLNLSQKCDENHSMNIANNIFNIFSNLSPGKLIDHPKDLQLWKEQSRLKTRDDMISLSREARKTLSHLCKDCRETDVMGSQFDPKSLLLKTIIADFIDKAVKKLRTNEFPDTSKDSTAPISPGQSQDGKEVQLIGQNLSLDAHYLYAEMETISFTVNGVVKTADGQEISFELNLNIEKTLLIEKDINIQTEDGNSTDPMIVNFSGTAAQLTSFSFEFEFESDDNNCGSFRRPGWGHIRFGADIKRLYDAFRAVMRTLKQADLGNLAETHEKKPGDSMGLQGMQLPFKVDNLQFDIETIMMKNSMYLHEDGNAGSTQQINLAL
jgi:hypothetical protein